MKGVIIVLGAQNDDRGRLSPMALQRTEKALKVFARKKDYQIIVTGGFGWNFNRTQKPHSSYLKRFLLEHGVKETQILATVQSRNTIQDLLLSKKVLDANHIKNFIVVTSGFHMPRVKLLCRKIFGSEYTIRFKSARGRIGPATRFIYSVHEVIRIVQILLFGFKSI